MSERSDAVVQVAIDRRIIAKIALHMESQNLYPRSMSEMLRWVIGTFETWIDKQGATEVATAIEATNIIEQRFKASLNPSGKYQQSLLKSMEEDDGYYSSREKDLAVLDKRIVREANKYLGIEPEPTFTKEELATQTNAALAAAKASEEAMQLTPLEVERNKAILEKARHDLEKYQKLANESTGKTRQQYELKRRDVIRYSQRASEGDNEALRILMDEL